MAFEMRTVGIRKSSLRIVGFCGPGLFLSKLNGSTNKCKPPGLDEPENSLGVIFGGFAGPQFGSDSKNCSCQVGFHPCCLQEVCPGFLFQNARFEIVTVTLALAHFFRKGPV